MFFRSTRRHLFLYGGLTTRILPRRMKCRVVTKIKSGFLLALFIRHFRFDEGLSRQATQTIGAFKSPIVSVSCFILFTYLFVSLREGSTSYLFRCYLFNVTNKLNNVILTMLDFYNLNERDDFNKKAISHYKVE